MSAAGGKIGDDADVTESLFNDTADHERTGSALDNEKDEEAAENDRDTQCGVFNWRPDCLQPFSTIWAFTATISAYTVFGNINYTYYTAVITQIERRFGLSSAMTGFIKNIDNIGFMATVVVVSHLCRYSNKPRLFAISAVLNAISIFLFGLPHFLFDGPDLSAIDPSSFYQNQTITPLSDHEICDGVTESQADDGVCRSRTRLADFNAGAMALFVASEILQGMAVAPKVTMSLTYMDDNVKDKSAAHFGVMFAMRAFSPLIGFLLGAWTNSIYVDLRNPGIDQKDPRWVGAWWIGFVLCGFGTILWAIPLVLFPSRMKGAQKVKDDQNLLSKSKDIPISLWRLLKNPVFMFSLLGGCFNMSLVGFSTFIPKYLESQFGLTASVASIYTGFISLLSWSIGPVISGFVVSRMKMTVTKALKFVVIVHVIVAVGYAITMFIGCTEPQWAGSMNIESQIKDAVCNSNCSCDATYYNPVCGSDGRNYFSPCYAGCVSDHNVTSTKTFEGCACVMDHVTGKTGTATLGLCSNGCGSMYVYMIILLLTGFITSMVFVPIMTTLLRAVEERDKAMSLAFSFFVTQLLGFPAPLLYGRVIDSTCLVKQVSCSRKGACLLYDHDLFRLRLHGLPAAGKIGAGLMYGAALYYSIKKDRKTRKQQEPEVENNNNKSEHQLQTLISSEQNNGAKTSSVKTDSQLVASENV